MATSVPPLTAGTPSGGEPAETPPPSGITAPPRWSVPIEIGLYVGIVLALDAVWGRGDRFMHVEPHPFWGIVLLLAAQYGTVQALLATVVCSLALLAGNLPPQGFEQSAHEYAIEVLQRPLLWMLASVVIGELRTSHRNQHLETAERLNHAERRAALLARAHKDVSAAKERLEARLAGQLRTATGMFEAARSLETLEPARVLEGAADLLSAALNARRFSMFLLERNELVLQATQGEGQAAMVRGYGATTPLFQEVVGAQRFVTVATAAGEAALAGEGLMAGPLIDPVSGKLFGMLKVEDMSFLDFNLSTVHTFKALCDWIAAAYGNALAHQASQIVDAKTQLYAARYLQQQTDYLSEVALRFGFNLAELTVRIELDDATEDERRNVSMALASVARRVLRRTDLVFAHEPPKVEFTVLLPGAVPETAGIVIRKLTGGLRDLTGREFHYTTRVRVLQLAEESPYRKLLRAGATPQAESQKELVSG
jgi:hypothetical protein